MKPVESRFDLLLKADPAFVPADEEERRLFSQMTELKNLREMEDLTVQVEFIFLHFFPFVFNKDDIFSFLWYRAKRD